MNIKRICQIQKSFSKGTESSSAPHCWGAREETSSLLAERAIFQWEQCGFVFERRRLSRQQEEWPLSSAFDAYDAFDFLTPTLIGWRRLPHRSLIRSPPRPSYTPPRPFTPCRRHQQQHLCSSLSHYLSLLPPSTTHTSTMPRTPLSAPAVIFTWWLNWVCILCSTETGVVGAAVGSSEGDEAIESDRMTESRREAAMEGGRRVGQIEAALMWNARPTDLPATWCLFLPLGLVPLSLSANAHTFHTWLAAIWFAL